MSGHCRLLTKAMFGNKTQTEWRAKTPTANAGMQQKTPMEYGIIIKTKSVWNIERAAKQKRHHVSRKNVQRWLCARAGALFKFSKKIAEQMGKNECVHGAEDTNFNILLTSCTPRALIFRTWMNIKQNTHKQQNIAIVSGVFMNAFKPNWATTKNSLLISFYHSYKRTKEPQGSCVRNAFSICFQLRWITAGRVLLWTSLFCLAFNCISFFFSAFSSD